MAVYLLPHGKVTATPSDLLAQVAHFPFPDTDFCSVRTTAGGHINSLWGTKSKQEITVFERLRIPRDDVPLLTVATGGFPAGKWQLVSRRDLRNNGRRCPYLTSTVVGLSLVPSAVQSAGESGDGAAALTVNLGVSFATART